MFSISAAARKKINAPYRIAIPKSAASFTGSTKNRTLSVRLLYLPNEENPADISRRQVGPRETFTRLKHSGEVEDLEIYSYLYELKRCTDESQYTNAICSVIEAFRPSTVLLQHAPKNSFPGRSFELIRLRYPNVYFVYHDEDPYDWPLKRINGAMKRIIPHCDAVFISALGDLERYYRSCGARNVFFINHYFDRERNGIIPLTPRIKNRDIVMIGNNGRHSRIPFLYYPGGRTRESLVVELTKIYGASFAVYGTGWQKYSSGKGRIAWNEQELKISESRISVNWDHFDLAPFYCSDRLPISLAAGVPHVTCRHPGYEYIFRNVPGLYLANGLKEILDIIKWLLSRSDQDLESEGHGAREWAFANMEANVIFRSMIDKIKSVS